MGNIKHGGTNFVILKAENSEDSLASSCAEFSIGLSCNPVWDWVTVGTRPCPWHVGLGSTPALAHRV